MARQIITPESRVVAERFFVWQKHSWQKYHGQKNGGDRDYAGQEI